ncbi:MAG: hypothetical protein JNL01_00590 [Bdellovibrionales bacterium]|nr:hypothetical protein [Bdellovibrionales bacterium]
MNFKSRLTAVTAFAWFVFSGLTQAWAGGFELKVGSEPVLKAILSESRKPGTAPEVYLLANQYRLDLTLLDLVDQTTLLLEGDAELQQRLRIAYESSKLNPFLRWYDELNLQIQRRPDLQERLDKRLRLQFYSPDAAAVRPNYSFIDLDKVKDNALLVRIARYNEYALDPEANGIRAVFEKTAHAPFITSTLTVAKLKEIKRKELKRIRSAYYRKLVELYQLYDPATEFYLGANQGHIKTSSETVSNPAMKIFDIINALPRKHEILLFVASQVKGIPYDQGFVLLTPSFIEKNHAAVEAALKQYTLNQLIQSPDDNYVLGVRRFIKKNRAEVLKKIRDYNKTQVTKLVLFHKNPDQLPSRAEALMDHEILLKIYPGRSPDELPWIQHARGLIFDKKGREKFLSVDTHGNVGRFFARLGRHLIQTETYLSILIGTATFLVSDGNYALALTAQKVSRDAIVTQRYDREWKEFFKEVPSDVLNAFLLGTGFSAGRFMKVLALGAGQGAIQSIFTGQDIRTGAAVGMFYSFLSFYVIPEKISRPMAKGFDEKALALNRKLETLQRSVQSALQGATVAAIDGTSIGKGAVGGAAYGFLSARFVIWLIGTRYNPFKDFADPDVDEMIELENQFQNEVGRGGAYDINRRLIMDANYRVGGRLQDWIYASITLPGNVAMSDPGFDRLTTLTHEAHHLMQQEQSGVFGFYLLRYLPTSFKTGYNGHPDENFLTSVLDSAHSGK